MKIKELRPSPIAGRWYPNDTEELRRTIRRYLANVERKAKQEEIVSIIVPHAGYIYSGQVAAEAYARLKGVKFDTVVICSPFHAYHPADILTSAHDAYSTPLGNVRVDKKTIEKLNVIFSGTGENDILPIAYDGEHSLEIQLPFLIDVIGVDFDLIPLMIRSHEFNVLERLAGALVEVLKDKKVLFVASTDLSHFYSAGQAHELDMFMINAMLEMDARKVLLAEKNSKGFACGAGAVATVLEVSKLLGAKEGELFQYATSGNVTGDTTNVVGYAALGLIR